MGRIGSSSRPSRLIPAALRRRRASSHRLMAMAGFSSLKHRGIRLRHPGFRLKGRSRNTHMGRHLREGLLTWDFTFSLGALRWRS